MPKTCETSCSVSVFFFLYGVVLNLIICLLFAFIYFFYTGTCVILEAVIVLGPSPLLSTWAMQTNEERHRDGASPPALRL